jgi:hypothetical protein
LAAEVEGLKKNATLKEDLHRELLSVEKERQIEQVRGQDEQMRYFHCC